jgi:hypothetical protein
MHTTDTSVIEYNYYQHLCYLPTGIHKRPTPQDFDVKIVSNHKDSDGKAIRQYSVDGIQTIGVVENEPFQIHFTNRSNEDVSVIVSLDGISVLSGKPADLDPDTLKWFVRRGSTLHLRAWHETAQGGARLVFTGEDKSVALHTSGDTSHKGIIAFAVFMEETAPNHSFNTIAYNNSSHEFRRAKGHDVIKGYVPLSKDSAGSVSNTFGYNTIGEVPTEVAACVASEETSVYSFDLDRERSVEDKSFVGDSVRKSAAIGAGEYTEQKTHTVKGLEKPTLNSILRMRYMFWDELEPKLQAEKARFAEDKFPSGFPAETSKKFADLTNVPRVVSESAEKKPEFTRVV